MNKFEMLTWVKQEFLPVELASDDATILQVLDNSIRYFNSYSAMKHVEMVNATTGTPKVSVSENINMVVKVVPASPPLTILMNYPAWSLLGIAVLDNVTSDMIQMTEAFKNYKYYIGSDFRWHFERNGDPTKGGTLHLANVPEHTLKLCVIGVKRVVVNEEQDYDIKDDFILNWVLRYVKALVKQVEGNVLRKAGTIGVKNDGDDLFREGKEEQKELQQELKDAGKWLAFIKRF